MIPEEIVKNGDERLVVINNAARKAVESQRGKHPKYVFTFRGKPLADMLNDGWKYACEQVGLPFLWVHDLKHTFGYRLRAAGVSFEDRQDLLGHKSKRITTHYSAAELSKLYEAANKVCHKNALSVPITLLKRKKDEGNRRPRKSVADRYSSGKSDRHPHKMPTIGVTRVSKIGY